MEEKELDKAPGRPVNPESKRQQRLAELEKRKAEGTLKLGRPVVPNSKKQQKDAEKAARIAAGEAPKRGRPKMTEEQRKSSSITLVTPVQAEVLSEAEIAALLEA